MSSEKPKVLLTRPLEDSKVIAALIKDRGFEAFIEPMLSVEACHFEMPDVEDYQSMIFTSAHGVRIVSKACKNRDIPVWVVGRNTLEEARKQGFENIEVGPGDAKSLSTMIRTRGVSSEKPFLYICGVDISYPLKSDFKKDGYRLDAVVVYEAQATDILSLDVLQYLDEKAFDYVLFFSTRTAQIFMDLVEQYGRDKALGSIKALCISESVLKSIQSQEWNAVYVSDNPDRTGMIEMLEKLVQDDAVAV